MLSHQGNSENKPQYLHGHSREWAVWLDRELRVLRHGRAVTLREVWSALGEEAQDTWPRRSTEKKQARLMDFVSG